MTVTARAYLTRCDLCNKQADARQNAQEQWVKPLSWGKITFENNPTSHRYADLCDECVAAMQPVLDTVVLARKNKYP